MLHSKSSSDFDLSPIRKASRLLNSVDHIWIEQIISSSGILDVATNDQGNDEEALQVGLGKNTLNDQKDAMEVGLKYDGHDHKTMAERCY